MNLVNGIEPNSDLGNALMELEQARLAAIRQFEAMQARKDQDIQEEWLMRQKEKSKNVVDLPNGGIVSLLIKSGEPEVKTLGEEIDELEAEAGHGAHLIALMQEFEKNYRNGLARFRLLPFLEDEDQVIACADELNNLKLDYRDDLEEFEALIGLVAIGQPFFCWLQEVKRHFNNLYSGRCGRDILLRQWLSSYLERDDLKEKAKPDDPTANPLQTRVERAFTEQDLEIPATYLPGYKQARAEQAKEKAEKAAKERLEKDQPAEKPAEAVVAIQATA